MSRKIAFCSFWSAALLFNTGFAVAQDETPDHSCTLSVAWQHTTPSGTEGSNFQSGSQGFQAGGGFRVTGARKGKYRPILFLTANLAFDRLAATPQAVQNELKENPPANPPTNPTARGTFTAVTFDPTLRFPI